MILGRYVTLEKPYMIIKKIRSFHVFKFRIWEALEAKLLSTVRPLFAQWAESGKKVEQNKSFFFFKIEFLFFSMDSLVDFRRIFFPQCCLAKRLFLLEGNLGSKKTAAPFNRQICCYPGSSCTTCCKNDQYLFFPGVVTGFMTNLSAN